MFALLRRRDESDIIERSVGHRFLTAVSVKMGRSKGRQAPTIPIDDSIIGQYTVGASRSVLR